MEKQKKNNIQLYKEYNTNNNSTNTNINNIFFVQSTNGGVEVINLSSEIYFVKNTSKDNINIFGFLL